MILDSYVAKKKTVLGLYSLGLRRPGGTSWHSSTEGLIKNEVLLSRRPGPGSVMFYKFSRHR